MDRTDLTPDPNELLEAALTDPESFDAARTARVVAQLEHDDEEVQRAASWALRFVSAETPELVDACAGRFRRALRDPAARSVALRTLAVLDDHNQEAVAEIIDGAVEAGLIDESLAIRTVAGYQPPEFESGGSVIADEGDEAISPTEPAVAAGREESTGSADGEDASPTPGHPPNEPPAKPPRLDRSLTEHRSREAAEAAGDSDAERIQFATSGREFTATCRRGVIASGMHDDAFRDAIERWRRIDDHDAVARVVDAGTRPVPWLVSERGAPGLLTERETPVSPAEARWILLQIADAVQYAHAAGVLHGAMWPGVITAVNAVEDPDAWAFPRVSDWGLREVFGPETTFSEIPDSYAAPEHVAPDRFGGVDTATDIYGLGMIGHELLTGAAPTRDDGTVHTRDVVTGIPEGLSTVLLKSLRTAKMERYASVAAFKRDLLS
ncbi:hypothetical protein PM022_08130 [Halorubrum ezzemoulense]|jgi:hypothetical protein|uniref:protein kinase domain-containing protein n=1 Tax=Halorubrum ezzemoulense TaxID=337243 RepID=UPI00232F5A2C|nr:hypothetical protein [Halorubrum ezzemoulense]MDB2274510.1 hypothetical protein [Halorubrum ezzemoulense]